MAGSVGLVQFNQGDDVTSAEFREGLNAIAQQAADGTAWAFGFGLIGSFSPGTGFTLAFDEALLPTMRKEHFIAKITAAATDDGGYEWVEMETTGENELGEKADGRTGVAADGEADPPVGSTLAYDYNGNKNLKVDRIVTMWEVEDTSGAKRYWIEAGGGADFIVAKITVAADDVYSWEEVNQFGITIVGGRTGDGNLREINFRSNIAPGHFVLIWPDPAVDGGYLFDRGEGIGGPGMSELGNAGGTTTGGVLSWDRTRGESGDRVGVAISVVTDVWWNDTNGKLMMAKRGMGFDSGGRLLYITTSGPYIEVTAAEDCPPPDVEEEE